MYGRIISFYYYIWFMGVVLFGMVLKVRTEKPAKKGQKKKVKEQYDLFIVKPKKVKK